MQYEDDMHPKEAQDAAEKTALEELQVLSFSVVFFHIDSVWSNSTNQIFFLRCSSNKFRLSVTFELISVAKINLS